MHEKCSLPASSNDDKCKYSCKFKSTECSKHSEYSEYSECAEPIKCDWAERCKWSERRRWSECECSKCWWVCTATRRCPNEYYESNEPNDEYTAYAEKSAGQCVISRQ